MRNEETNCANFVSDVLRTEFADVDLALVTAGTLRSNAIIPKGDITLHVVNELLPMADKIIKLRVPGDVILSLLENSVSQWPAHDGRFCTISGLKYSFDADCEPGNRIHSVETLDGQAFDLSAEACYVIVAKEFVAMGKDGFEAFTDSRCQWISKSDAGSLVTDVIV